MIRLTKINREHEAVWINPFLIETATRQTDTLVTLVNGHKYVVVEPPEEISERSIDYMRQIGIVGTHFLDQNRS